MTNDRRTAIMHDAHIHFHGRYLLLPRNLFERFEFILWMRPTIHDSYVLRAANVRQPARNIVRIVVAATGN